MKYEQHKHRATAVIHGSILIIYFNTDWLGFDLALVACIML